MAIDLTGKIFDSLNVIKYHSTDKHGHTKWLCKCKCGNETVVIGDNLTRGHTKSCGCEGRRRTVAVKITHGMTNTRPYHTWENMIARCYRKSTKAYRYYGGRGIVVCDKWLTFEGFWADMKDGYSDDLTIERKDVNGNYDKQNCVWATVEAQANNKRNNVVLSYKGEEDTLTRFSAKYGISVATLWARIFVLGWDIGRALETPVRHRNAC